jgi:uncharacterized membrane protein YciS (DUF1049 family)
LKNAHEVTLRFFFNSEWHTPLALLLLAFFVLGGLLGMLAMTPIIFRKRHEASAYKKELKALQHEKEARQTTITRGPQADVVIDS